MNYAIIRNRQPHLPVAPTSGTKGSIRRIFDNSQLIERFDKWLLICGKAANTRTSYVGAAKQFAKFIEKPLTAATKEDVSAFIGSLYARNFAPATMQQRLDSLRVLFDCLQLGSQVRASAPRYIPRRKLPRRLPKALSEKEIERLIAAARTVRDAAIIELGYASGLRVNELANLRVEDVDLRARTLIVRQGKGGNDRVALFGRPAAAMLHAYLGKRSTGPLFLQHPRQQRGGVTRDKYGAWWGKWREGGHMHSVRLGDYELPNDERARAALDAILADKLPPRRPDEKRMGKKGVYRVIVQTAKRAGISGVHPHILRHSCATHCLDHGMDVRHVAELLGHVTVSTTQKYLHVSTTHLKGVHTKFFRES